MESAGDVLGQLTAIKWLLVAIGICTLLVLVTFFVIAVNAIAIQKETRQGASTHAKQTELEDLLATGQGKAAKFIALEWIAAQPKRPEAYWALVKAHYQLDELSEAKQALSELLRIAPDERYRVDAWLELLNGEFSKKRPKSVD